MIFDHLDSSLVVLVKRVGRISSSLGVKAYLIGGCVRDLILNRPVIDLDFAVENNAFAVAQKFAKQLNGVMVAYHQFLTATVTLPDGRKIDFSSLRQEEYPSPGALPDVRKGSLSVDLYRRDFSVNAMAVSVNSQEFGNIFDSFGGVNDIERKKIRVLHDKSFIDDPTRMLRAVRFEQRLGFKLEFHTEKLLRKALKDNALDSVKSQRLFEEFKKNLNEPLALRNLMRLSKLGLLKKTRWGINITARQSTALRQLDRIFLRISSLERIEEISRWLIRLMILLEGASKVRSEELMGVWALPSADRAKVLSVKELVPIFRSKSLKLYGQKEMFHLLRTRSDEELLYFWANPICQQVRPLVIKALTKWRTVALKISGDDLMHEGIPAGKIYKQLLDDVLYRVAMGDCQKKDEQLAYVRKLYSMSGQ
ncbi:MAG: CCA tRNA nucleotidyltransferase [Candidatus Omnitrophica bacterium]|nr:CCA tRNA nucleotidyltransferase [Candidatus Omnitrophota bacterium]